MTAAVRRLSLRMPTYVTIKDVKKRWGHGQEDVFPVSQFEKLWGDMTSLPEVACRFVVVPRAAGPATQGTGATRQLAPRRLGRLRRRTLSVVSGSWLGSVQKQVSSFAPRKNAVGDQATAMICRSSGLPQLVSGPPRAGLVGESD